MRPLCQENQVDVYENVCVCVNEYALNQAYLLSLFICG